MRNSWPFGGGGNGKHIIKLKGKEAGIIASDFTDKKNGYLALTKEEYIAPFTLVI